jgi:putative aldouronate transport system permease protein
MQNPLNLPTSEIISTFVYKVGIQGIQYSFGAAVDLFNSLVNLLLILGVNRIAKRASRISLW